jgi:hypothetical protein
MVMDADESEQTRLSKTTQGLRAVVELHKPSKIPNWVPTNHKFICDGCTRIYPCPTIQAIEKELR